MIVKVQREESPFQYTKVFERAYFLVKINKDYNFANNSD